MWTSPWFFKGFYIWLVVGLGGRKALEKLKMSSKCFREFYLWSEAGMGGRAGWLVIFGLWVFSSTWKIANGEQQVTYFVLKPLLDLRAEGYGVVQVNSSFATAYPCIRSIRVVVFQGMI